MPRLAHTFDCPTCRPCTPRSVGTRFPLSVVQRLIIIEGGTISRRSRQRGRPLTARRAAGRTVAGVIAVAVQETPVVRQAPKCCTPVPGDTIMGFTTRGQGFRCIGPTARTPTTCGSSPERLVEVPGRRPGDSFLVAVQFEGWTGPACSTTSREPCQNTRQHRVGTMGTTSTGLQGADDVRDR